MEISAFTGKCCLINDVEILLMTDDNYHFYCGSVEISVFTGKCCLINDVEILLMIIIISTVDQWKFQFSPENVA